MNTMNLAVFSGTVVDESTLTIHEMACACAVETTWITERVADGLLACENATAHNDERDWRFASAALIRARRLANIERTFDANAEVSALVVDLLEEVSVLREQIAAQRGAR